MNLNCQFPGPMAEPWIKCPRSVIERCKLRILEYWQSVLIRVMYSSLTENQLIAQDQCFVLTPNSIKVMHGDSEWSVCK